MKPLIAIAVLAAVMAATTSAPAAPQSEPVVTNGPVLGDEPDLYHSDAQPGGHYDPGFHPTSPG